jgi:hypothetical protein
VLFRSIQQEQQGKPGLPPDLHELMALNIVTNETDAMAKQQAMDQLAQMQGPQGKPPTVLESVREQARQKMEAQAVQAQRQQQGLQALMQQARSPQVPENTPQPEAQPQGIDDLPVEFGLAGGGIVAFKNGGSSGEDLDAAREREKEARSQLMSYGLARRKDDPEGFEQAKMDAEAAAERRRAAEAMYAQEMSAAGMDRPVQVTGMPKAPARPQAGQQTAAPQTSTPQTAAQAEPFYDPAQATRRSQYEGGIRDLVDRPAPQVPRPSPQTIPMPTMGSAQTAAPVEKSKSTQKMEEYLDKSPENERVAAMDRLKAMIKEPDTTQRDAMIKQLQAERDRQVGPQDSFGQLMEYLGQIAATPRGLSSFEAGAAGARGVRGLEEQRAQKRFDLGSKIIEQEQGKIDASRAFAKEMFNVGEKEYDQILKAQFEAAKQITSNEMEALKLAKQEALKIMELRQNAQIENSRIAGQASRDVDSRLLQAYIDAAGGDVVKAHQNMTKAQGKEKVDPYTAELMKKIADAEVAAAGMPGKIGDQKRAELAALKRQAGIAGGAQTGGGNQFTVSAGGKTYTFPTQEAANKFKAEAGVK